MSDVRHMSTNIIVQIISHVESRDVFLGSKRMTPYRRRRYKEEKDFDAKQVLFLPLPSPQTSNQLIHLVNNVWCAPLS